MFKTAKEQKPTLNDSLDPDLFKNHYWLKTQLLAFCRENNLSSVGTKESITDRILHFLHTGERKVTRDDKNIRATRDSTHVITADRPVINYKNDVATRKFFLDYIGPHFHFTVPFHDYRRKQLPDGHPITYGDLAEYWKAQYAREQDPSFKRSIPTSCEFNQFTRDFFDAVENKEKTRADANRAWKIVTSTIGPNTYQFYSKQLTNHTPDNPMHD